MIRLQKKKTDKTGEPFKGNKKDGIEWYPTGWTYSEKTGKWERPDFVDKAALEEKRKQFRQNGEPTYEEWKATRLAEQNKTPEE